MFRCQSSIRGRFFDFRHRGTNPGNLVPTNTDARLGAVLSFSTISAPNSWQTTVDDVNSTGVLYAIVDEPNHVSVYPIGATVAEWRNAGSNSIWTQTLMLVSKKIK